MGKWERVKGSSSQWPGSPGSSGSSSPGSPTRAWLLGLAPKQTAHALEAPRRAPRNPPKRAAPAAIHGLASLSLNDCVRVVGVRASLDGAIGTVVGQAAESGRVPVRLDPPHDKMLRLRPENLESLSYASGWELSLSSACCASSSSPMSSPPQQRLLTAAEDAAAARDEYERLIFQAEQASLSGNPKAAVELVKRAIAGSPAGSPGRSNAHVALGDAYRASEQPLRASECFIAAAEHCEPRSEGWASAVVAACNMRRRAVPCGLHSGDGSIFCQCERCAELPERPMWMWSPHALLQVAKQVVAATPEDAPLEDRAAAWRMHAQALFDFEDFPKASDSFTKAGKLFGDGGHATHTAECLENARRCLENPRYE
jgi:hypothetical protein